MFPLELLSEISRLGAVMRLCYSIGPDWISWMFFERPILSYLHLAASHGKFNGT